jgi:hypothetical protein
LLPGLLNLVVDRQVPLAPEQLRPALRSQSTDNKTQANGSRIMNFCSFLSACRKQIS